MNEIIEDFITDTFAPEFCALVRKSFSLFEAFEHQNAYGEMMDACTNESVSDPAGRADHFTVALGKQLDFVLDQHLVKLTSEATLRNRIDVLDALYRFQHLENYIALSAILNTDADSIDKMAKILQELTEMHEGTILTILHEVDPDAIRLMQLFVDDKETPEETEFPNPQVIRRVKLFAEVFGKETVGYAMIISNMILDLPVRKYLPFVDQHLITEGDDEKTAINILSVFYMSDLKEEQMLTMYREIGEEIFKTLEDTARVEGFILQALAKLADMQKVKHEQARLLKESAASKPA